MKLSADSVQLPTLPYIPNNINGEVKGVFSIEVFCFINVSVVGGDVVVIVVVNLWLKGRYGQLGILSDVLYLHRSILK